MTIIVCIAQLAQKVNFIIYYVIIFVIYSVILPLLF